MLELSNIECVLMLLVSVNILCVVGMYLKSRLTTQREVASARVRDSDLKRLELEIRATELEFRQGNLGGGVNWDKDVEFLNHLTGLYLEIEYENTIKTEVSKRTSRADFSILHDEVIFGMIEDVTVKILSKLSPAYRTRMESYMSADSLEQYVIDLVSQSIIKYTLDENSRKVSRMTGVKTVLQQNG